MTGVGKFIPKPLKYLFIVLYVFMRCILRGTPSRDIKVNLAEVLPPIGSKKIVHGGKVKLLHLRERFGDSWKKFNIGYFVSSGLPFAPAIWIKIYKLFGIKVVWNQNGVAYPAWAREKTESINKLLTPIHLSDYVVYQTEFCKKCSDKYLGKYSGPSSVLINPVDTNHFKSRETPLPPEPLVIIMSGHHFESRERLNISLEAVRKVREKGIDARLLIIGNTQECPYEEWVEKIGAYLQEDAPKLFHRAHMMLHLKYLDPCPTLVLETLACGLPVIGSRSGGMPELVSEQSGILLPVKEDFEKLHYPEAEEVLKAILTIRKNYGKFRDNARRDSLRFDKHKWLEQHEEIFKKLLNE